MRAAFICPAIRRVEIRTLFSYRSVVLFLVAVLVMSQDLQAEPAQYRDWIVQMKEAPRGPFSRVRWFCNDGTDWPPTPRACDGHGGGAQHGEWTDQVKAMRADGYFIANILSNLKVEDFLTEPNHRDRLAQIVLEQFLLAIDDGWILRHARYYRGALQEEGERRGARRLLFKMAEDREWLRTRYVMLRTAARFIPHGSETDQITQIRQLSTDLARRDAAFQLLRNKIHVRPDATDADAVFAYAAAHPDSEHLADYELLASTIRSAYQPSTLVEYLDKLAVRLQGSGELSEILRAAATRIATAENVEARFIYTAELLRVLRDQLLVPNSPDRRLALVNATLKLEAEHFAAGTELRDELHSASRSRIIDWLLTNSSALYGAGLISERQRAAIEGEMQRLRSPEVSLTEYRDALGFLARVPGWGTSSLSLYFGEAMQRFAAIEPLSLLFIQDQLRGSALFFFAQALDVLQRDAEQLAGVRNELFGERISGMRSLNPGFARGVLRFALTVDETTEFDRNGIYVLHETIADLPPVAGIITAGEGNPLSHVQLLARNLGIPNVAISEQLMERLRRHAGETVVLAVGQTGSVEIRGVDPEALEDAGEETGQPAVRIVPDMAKIELGFREIPTLDSLRAADSGRIVGPKAAKLAELRHHFPEAVANGIVVPFGEFRALLEQPKTGTTGTVFEWMVEQYEHLATLPVNSPQREAQTQSFRQVLEAWILHADPGDEFRERLRKAMEETFGEEGSYGVFVRSDTNVEDLPGFTGAGLNLTVPNVVGFDAVIEAVSRVWASPFSARAFAWRQNFMPAPQHVYPAVLLQLTVPVDKSGVMVTRDIDSGDDRWLSIAANEGVGGAVDGQAAESLRVEISTGRVRLLAQAAAPWKRITPATGGIVRIPVSGSSVILQAEEIAQLIRLAETLPQQFPPITDEQGEPAPADIEFGFLGGELRLFQIRPFLESTRMRNHEYLANLDRQLVDTGPIRVDLSDRPLTEGVQ